MLPLVYVLIMGLPLKMDRPILSPLYVHTESLAL